MAKDVSAVGGVGWIPLRLLRLLEQEKEFITNQNCCSMNVLLYRELLVCYLVSFFGTEQGGKGSEFMDSTKMFR